MFVWHEYENAAAASEALADAVAAALQNALDNKGSAVLAVSGGRSPIPFFQALSQKDLDWQKVGITLVDERIVPRPTPTATLPWHTNTCCKTKPPQQLGFPLSKRAKLKLNYNPTASLPTR